MPMFEESDFSIQGPISPTQLSVPYDNMSVGSHDCHHLAILGDDGEGPIEVPASRSSISEAAKYMHNLSMPPSQKDRRSSRNSFGASLPIPRSKRRSRLSSVHYAEDIDGRPTRPGMPGIQPTREILASQIQTIETQKVAKAKNMAFAFDIDGVLVHGDQLIPEGKRALEILNGDNELSIKIPHIFLTNGSGKPEQARCDQLSKILKNPVSTEQFIQSHTPMSALASYYHTVLVVGGVGYRCREVAEQYGFKDVVVPNDIVAWDPTIAPIANSPNTRRRCRDRGTSAGAISRLSSCFPTRETTPPTSRSSWICCSRRTAGSRPRPTTPCLSAFPSISPKAMCFARRSTGRLVCHRVPSALGSRPCTDP